MTVEMIRGRVETIRKMAAREIRVASDGDPHMEEVELWKDTLRAIADGDESPRQLAIEALKTTQIGFGREYS